MGFDIPLLPFPARWILPSVQILISSVSAQNPPVLLPPKRVCPLPICPSRRCRSQPLPGVSRKRRYNTLDFPRKSRVPTGVLLAPIGNPEPRGYSPLDTPCFRHLCIHKLVIDCIFNSFRKHKNPTDHIHTRMKSVGFFIALISSRKRHYHFNLK